jgi:hypothetical protein
LLILLAVVSIYFILGPGWAVGTGLGLRRRLSCFCALPILGFVFIRSTNIQHLRFAYHSPPD